MIAKQFDKHISDLEHRVKKHLVVITIHKSQSYVELFAKAYWHKYTLGFYDFGKESFCRVRINGKDVYEGHNFEEAINKIIEDIEHNEHCSCVEWGDE